MTAPDTHADDVIGACVAHDAEEVVVHVGETPIAVRAPAEVMDAFDGFSAFTHRSPSGSGAEPAPCAVIHVAAGERVGAAMPPLPTLDPSPAGRPAPEAAILTVLGGESPMVSAASADRRQAAVWLPDLARHAWWDRARPLLPAVQAVLRDTPWSVLHAAAVGRDGAATLLTGGSHAGKTTLSLTAMLHGADFFGDDVVAVALPSGPGTAVRVARLYDTARLRLPAMPSLAPLAEEGTASEEHSEHRRELRLAHRLAGRATTAPVTRLIHVTRAGALRPTFGGARRGTVISTVTATTLQVSFGDLRHRATITTLCGLLPPAGFDPGPDVDAAVRALLPAPSL